MDGHFSGFQTTAWMDQMEAKDKWMALVSANPLIYDPLTCEIIGGVYTRELGTWVRTAVNMLTMSEELVWHNLVPGTVVAGVVGFDAQFNGNLLFSDMLTTPISYVSGGTYVLPGDQYVIGMDIVTLGYG